jgi:CDP-diacylglycerol--glycerol-3-phosphate 3-phosphatidyltransferase
LVPFFFSFLLYFNEEHPSFRWLALAVFITAVITDALDGLIARHFHQQTKFGTFLDPFADKLLLVSGYLAIVFSSSFQVKPPIWVVVVIVFRDLLIICGLIIIYLATNRLEIKPNVLGKLTTFFQMLTLSLVLLRSNAAVLSWNVTVFFTIVSAMAYIVRGIHLLNGRTSRV